MPDNPYEPVPSTRDCDACRRPIQTDPTSGNDLGHDADCPDNPYRVWTPPPC